nr:DUF4062 domain-containing protein [uncultured Flavobacterium sp.]
MKDKKLQVFVSSTYVDLKEERQAAVEAILSAGHIPAGMELFSAGDESQMTVIKRWIDESDVYLLILGGRYGSIDPSSGKSYTHLEYEYAIEQGKPLFAVVINQAALDGKVKTNGMAAIEQDSPHLLKEFKTQVLSNLVKFFDDKKDIKLAVHETLSDFNYRKDLVGWVRGDNSVNTGLLAEEIARLTKENSDLRFELSKDENGTSQILYNNLSFDELHKLLNREKNVNEETLYELLILYGKLISREYTFSNIEEKKVMSRLAAFKIVKLISRNTSGHHYSFTDQGHDFYLRALLNEG